MRFNPLKNAQDIRDCCSETSPSLAKKKPSDTSKGTFGGYHVARGWMANDTQRKESASAMDSYRRNFEKRRGGLQDLERFSSRIEKFTNDHPDLTLVLFRFPVSAELMTLEDNMSGIDFRELQKITSLNPRVQWISDIPYSELHYYDSSHLNAATARTFSTWLGKKVSALLNR